MQRKWKTTSKALGEQSLSDFETADFVLPSLMACPTASGMHLPRQLIQWRCISSRWKTGVSTYLRTWDDIILIPSNTNTLTFEPLDVKVSVSATIQRLVIGSNNGWFPISRIFGFLDFGCHSFLRGWRRGWQHVPWWSIPKFQNIFVTGHYVFIVLNHLSSFVCILR